MTYFPSILSGSREQGKMEEVLTSRENIESRSGATAAYRASLGPKETFRHSKNLLSLAVL